MRVFNRAVLGAFLGLISTTGCAAARQASIATPGSSATRDPAHTTLTASGEAADPMQGAPKEPLPWADFSAATFARAKAERRFIVMDGSAEWCHWCHVMEATTYHDPAIKKLLAEHFVQIKVDIDSRPDIEERYGEY